MCSSRTSSYVLGHQSQIAHGISSLQIIPAHKSTVHLAMHLQITRLLQGKVLSVQENLLQFVIAPDLGL